MDKKKGWGGIYRSSGEEGKKEEREGRKRGRADTRAYRLFLLLLLKSCPPRSAKGNKKNYEEGKKGKLSNEIPSLGALSLSLPFSLSPSLSARHFSREKSA